MNFCRVFVFRIPVLWALQQFTDLGNVSVGIVMVVSNVCSGILAAVIGIIEIRKLRRMSVSDGMESGKLSGMSASRSGKSTATEEQSSEVKAASEE